MLPYQDYSRTVFTTMKNEAPYMLEWIAYHLSIGFTHFAILTNNCSDETEKIARNLARAGLVSHRNNPEPYPLGPQKTGYNRMRRLAAFSECEWMMTLDCDEFLRIDVGNGHLDDLFSAIGDNAKAISFNWQLFGNSGHVKLQERTLPNFTKAIHPLQARPYEARPFKTLYKNGYFEKLGTHRPINFLISKSNEFDWIDADGVSIKNLTRMRHWHAQPNGFGFGTALGRINHYALRSLESFILKWSRGFVHPNAPTVRGKGRPIDYWQLFNWNDVKEDKILEHSDRTIQYYDALIDIDKKFERFQTQSYEMHRKQAQEIRKIDPDLIQELKDHKTSERTQPLPDFSKFGCPPVGNELFININNLRKKLEHSCLPQSLIENLYTEDLPSR